MKSLRAAPLALSVFSMLFVGCGEDPDGDTVYGSGTNFGEDTGDFGDDGDDPDDGDPGDAGDGDAGDGDGDAGDGDTDDGDGGDGDGDDAGDGDGDDDGPSFGAGSAFDDVNDMFNYLNDQRLNYQPHSRWKGFPFGQGEYHQNITWPLTMEWSDEAAALAQAEADAVAAGQTPAGQQTAANLGQGPLHVYALNTDQYMVSATEYSGKFNTNLCTPCKANGFMRMAVYYHDPGGDGAVMTKLGVGAADMGNGDTRWVFRFAP
jgi:hypothetical protein